MFWSSGYGATTPQQLADRLEIAKGSLYNAFGGKRQLYDLALARYLDMRAQSVGAMLEAQSAMEFVEQMTKANPTRLNTSTLLYGAAALGLP
ncbi:TetR/AcrR family transcriptional regulator [Mycobacterium sp. GA-2829]|uniref:TetR/AcrR family transcriptional regulator n=1 Tax=Mycobacterium sp. GA-2829 TaxID=1772283 RepID=UPI0007403B53|nr:TetR family transcriptional regulator [Mycobacterium sp. GA-2829]KUI22255.1 hypothetical protein AU194_05785 [Mycobacterium sp. GA-2829]